jgi:hypothetical protein
VEEMEDSMIGTVRETTTALEEVQRSFTPCEDECYGLHDARMQANQDRHVSRVAAMRESIEAIITQFSSNSNEFHLRFNAVQMKLNELFLVAEADGNDELRVHKVRALQSLAELN